MPCVGWSANQTDSVHTELPSGWGLSTALSVFALSGVRCWWWEWGRGDAEGEDRQRKIRTGERWAQVNWWEPRVEENVLKLFCPGNISVCSLPALYFPLASVGTHHTQLSGERVACGGVQVFIQRVQVQKVRQAVAELVGGGLLVRCSLLLWRPMSESFKLASLPLRWLDSQHPRAVGV